MIERNVDLTSRDVARSAPDGLTLSDAHRPERTRAEPPIRRAACRDAPWLQSAGAEDNSFTFFPELMDSASLFLTGNSDTVYFWGFIDLSDGPMVLDVPALGPPSGLLGTIDDMWFNWVTDIGLPGPDRGAGAGI
jgi:hypothetical protein